MTHGGGVGRGDRGARHPRRAEDVGEAHRREGTLAACCANRSSTATAGGSRICACRSPTAATSAASTACPPRGCRGWSATRCCASRRSSGWSALLAEMGVRDLRLTGGEPLVRRDFPRLAAMLALVEGLREVSVTTNGYLLERDAAALADAGVRARERVDRLAPARPLLRDDPPRLAAPGAARARRRGAPSRAAAGEGERRGDPRLHRAGGAAVRRVRARARLPGALHRVHAARRRPRVDRRPGAHRRGAARDHPRRAPARGAAARAVGHGAGVPLRRRPRARSASSTRSPSRSARTATASG